jgi:predicted lipoprotein with Yx(FWY)xxD motif
MPPVRLSAHPTHPRPKEHIVKTRTSSTILGAVIVALALAGCATSGGTSSGSSGSGSTSSSPSAAAKDAGVASTKFGSVIVDGKGMTAYFFNKDTANSGTSACTGQCATLWQAITSTSATPSVSGVTATVATITGVAGGKQITINGRPIYTYSKDTAPGDTNGEGVGGLWYVVSPSGQEITSAKSGY